ncbi:hypothetical protein FBZ89_104172 [Nitrospirillum amazonense]|uniref:Uncharacterized protein n=1 Tax=Nitrospirillum amazonense TaxID=28077 RepID=A0A560FJY1_9PROT|nr:hypothetical protein [Nitrospirillum amazonense]TWB21924.1 hypothetical protein FBZ89_104172 [Nitrospirillum amazonense]
MSTENGGVHADIKEMIGLTASYDPFREICFMERLSGKVLLQVGIFLLCSVVAVCAIFPKYVFEIMINLIGNGASSPSIILTDIAPAIILISAFTCLVVLCGRLIPYFVAGGLIIWLGEHENALSVFIKKGPIADTYIDIKIILEDLSFDGNFLNLCEIGKLEFAYYSSSKKIPIMRVSLGEKLKSHNFDEGRLLRITLLHVHEMTGVRKAQVLYLDKELLAKAAERKVKKAAAASMSPQLASEPS